MATPSTPGAYRLVKADTVIYVGHTDNLARRSQEWATDPDNACVKRKGYDKFVYEPTRTVDEAKKLECLWYKQYKHECNEIAPEDCD